MANIYLPRKGIISANLDSLCSFWLFRLWGGKILVVLYFQVDYLKSLHQLCSSTNFEQYMHILVIIYYFVCHFWISQKKNLPKNHEFSAFHSLWNNHVFPTWYQTVISSSDDDLEERSFVEKKMINAGDKFFLENFKTSRSQRLLNAL